MTVMEAMSRFEILGVEQSIGGVEQPYRYCHGEGRCPRKMHMAGSG
jgi:hypothetical protein